MARLDLQGIRRLNEFTELFMRISKVKPQDMLCPILRQHPPHRGNRYQSVTQSCRPFFSPQFQNQPELPAVFPDGVLNSAFRPASLVTDKDMVTEKVIEAS